MMLSFLITMILAQTIGPLNRSGEVLTAAGSPLLINNVAIGGSKTFTLLNLDGFTKVTYHISYTRQTVNEILVFCQFGYDAKNCSTGGLQNVSAVTAGIGTPSVIIDSFSVAAVAAGQSINLSASRDVAGFVCGVCTAASSGPADPILDRLTVRANKNSSK